MGSGLGVPPRLGTGDGVGVVCGGAGVVVVWTAADAGAGEVVVTGLGVVVVVVVLAAGGRGVVVVCCCGLFCWGESSLSASGGCETAKADIAIKLSKNRSLGIAEARAFPSVVRVWVAGMTSQLPRSR